MFKEFPKWLDLKDQNGIVVWSAEEEAEARKQYGAQQAQPTPQADPAPAPQKRRGRPPNKVLTDGNSSNTD